MTDGWSGALSDISRARCQARLLAIGLLAFSLLAGCNLSGEMAAIVEEVGDGSLTDAGVGSYYPRFIVRVRPCALGNERVCMRRLEGLPEAAYTIHARFIHTEHGHATESEIDWTTLEAAKVSLAVEVHQANGGEPIRSSEGPVSSNWKSWWAGDTNFFYSPALEEIPLLGNVVVSVSTSVSDIDRLGPEAKVEVQLHGGGVRK